jgi:agmatine deiminase
MTDMLPSELGFKLAPEWAPHKSTWLTWPHNKDTWPGKFDPVPEVFGELCRAILPYETLNIIIDDFDKEDQALDIILNSAEMAKYYNKLVFHHFPSNDAWCRDHGPCYVIKPAEYGNQRAIINWGYNAWGGKYPPFDLDNEIPLRIADRFSFKVFDPGMILEGGSIDTNGQGCLLSTRSCLLNPNRNPGLTESEIEQRLKDYLGVEKILWLPGGIVGDDTDGHIDDIARFVNPYTIVAAVEDNPDDENYTILQENLKLLTGFTDTAGKPFDIHTLPMPPKIEFQGERLPASYANFYIANNVVVMPTFGHHTDEIALNTLKPLFPDREVVGINCKDLVLGLGTLHCITHEEPE